MHDCAESFINQTMPLNRVQTIEGLCHDAHAKVTATAARARVTDVQVALVFDAELYWREYLLEAGTDTFRSVAHLLKLAQPFGSFNRGASVPSGLRSGSQRIWANMKTTVSAVTPYTLKSTHACSLKVRAT